MSTATTDDFDAVADGQQNKDANTYFDADGNVVSEDFSGPKVRLSSTPGSSDRYSYIAYGKNGAFHGAGANYTISRIVWEVLGLDSGPNAQAIEEKIKAALPPAPKTGSKSLLLRFKFW